LKTKFDVLSSDRGTYDKINFWSFLPRKNFLELRKIAQSYMYVILKWCTHANKHFRLLTWLKAKQGHMW